MKNLIVRGDEVGYISEEDDQSFGMFIPIGLINFYPKPEEVVVQFVDDNGNVLEEY